MIASSATAGQPRSPRRPDSAPSFIWAPSVSRGSCACWATTPSKALTYSSARRISTASPTHRPSSEKTRTPAAESAIAPSSASCSPRRPTVTAPTGNTSTSPAALAQVPDLFDHAGRVGDRVGVGHRVDGGEAAQRGGRASPWRPSRRPRGRARAGACAGRPGPAARPVPSPSMTVGVGDAERPGRRRSRAIRPPSTRTSAGSPPSGPGSGDQVACHAPLGPSRAAGTARPSAR